MRERRYETPRAARNMFQQPEHGTLAFFQVGLIAQVGFIIVALTGVAMVMVYGRHQSLAALLHKLL